VQHSIKVNRSARYETLGPEDTAVREVWFVLHGYGQLAAAFIRAFDALDDGTRLIVAPEALSRFYLADVASAPAAERPVGATWMTREDRASEIEDYVSYLDAVAAEILARVRREPRLPSIVVLGFSQGAATAARWVSKGTIRPRHVIFWGGSLPPEIDSPERGERLRAASLHVVIGTRDRFVSPERMNEEEQRLRDSGVPYRLVRYEGGHGISREALRELSRSLGAEGA